MRTAYCVAVKQLGIAPSEFWRLPPRHFWWLVADNTKSSRSLSREDRRAIIEALRGNPRGPIW